MICVEERQGASFYLWGDRGKTPIEIDDLRPELISRLETLRLHRVGERIDGCGSRLMANVFVIYEDHDDMYA